MRRLLELATLLSALAASAAQDNYIDASRSAPQIAAGGIVKEVSKAAPVKISQGGIPVKIAADLSHIKSTTVDYANITVWGKTLDTAACSPSITVRCDGKIAGARTFHNGDNRSCVIITREVNEALRHGKKTLELSIAQEGVIGAQKQWLLNRAEFVVLQKPLADRCELMRPIWKSGKITDDPVFFVDDENAQPPRAKLLFTPKKILRAHTNDVEFTEGKDFRVIGDTVEFIKGGAMPVRKISQIYTTDPSVAKKCDCAFFFSPIKKFGLFHEGVWFKERTVCFTYEHDGDDKILKDLLSVPAKNNLPKTLARLKAGKPLKIVLFGDSIAYGANASGVVGKSTFSPMGSYPYMPSWGDLVAEQLRKKYPESDITFLNRALGGTDSNWGVKNIESLVAADLPDVVILAFGMNDGCTATQRTDSIKKMSDCVRAKNPDAEFVIVSPMSANPLWRSETPHSSYPQADKESEQTGTAVADVWHIHKYLLSKKKYLDLTGNNVNHPNDFLIRAYALTILAQFGLGD